jgi:hypothetical protein
MLLHPRHHLCAMLADEVNSDALHCQRQSINATRAQDQDAAAQHQIAACITAAGTNNA